MKLLFFLFFSVLIFSTAFASDKPVKSKGQKIFKILWSEGLKPGPSKKRYFPEISSPISDGVHTFVGTHSGYFYAVNKNGAIDWKFNSNGPIASGPHADGNSVFFGNNKGFLYALDGASGKQAWSNYVGAEILAAPISDGSSLYVVTSSREVYSFDKDTGKQKWVAYVKGFDSKITMRGHAGLSLDGSRLYAAFSDGQIASISLEGDLIWSKQYDQGNSQFRDIDGDLLVDDRFIYASGYFGEVAQIAKSTGHTVWKKSYSTGATMGFDEDSLYLTTTDGKVIALSRSTGLRKWELNLHAGTLSSPLVFNDYVLVATELGRLYVMDRSKGEILQDIGLSGGAIGNLTMNGPDIYLLTASARLYAIRAN
ncbi:MAG: hypothetical protein A3G32_08095 [Deltaproteobacteria bacterium RIFCSPLOWO2_12_FULL_40_28]|nr:MAG: hypothetical protein A3C45_00795 [Deltaproteobacteria bacterium RIFCSPHIGHO2_02_FULL_40_28]OGQ20871.1 MAG: hypothetical protein A3E27_03460 [Deltaproteobacteria bacterium RIFCSPHIGHO2_12_FULL_40_32]OGQ39272.1 MAG: hypothetical protein A3I69_04820 [Deltaproteobacteria bacterium RIFCSPLOWO2_02_FULL_40_36]OGQ54553.1 MAG: hypothetical protein A3G32_08095 [Deltaproteobacteria bacterium RIFCSPLOWO2_12_FULL_40_28]